MSQKPIIKISNLYKSYKTFSTKKKFFNFFLKQSKNEDFLALKNINLEIFRGDKIGIVGPNGAGKSTLLKIMAGISRQTKGKIYIHGKIVSLMDLEAGFHPDLTGVDNIYISGMIIGMNKKEIDEKYPQIIKFADIGKFIDAPFYTYSNGMKFRLAFAIAMASQCEILIIDEVFISGDLEFQIKSMKLIQKLQKKNNITTILCSHIPGTIFNFSNKFYQIKNGELTQCSRNEIIEDMRNHSKSWKKTFRY